MVKLEEKIDGWKKPKLNILWHFPKARRCELCEKERGIYYTPCRKFIDIEFARQVALASYQ